MARRKRQPSLRLPAARPKRGKVDCRCSSIAQNNRSANAASRSRLAWLNVFLAGGRAPRMAASAVRCNFSASHTSFRLLAWLSCACSIATTWSHAVNVRAWSSTPVSRASFATSCVGISSQICRSTARWGRFG